MYLVSEDVVCVMVVRGNFKADKCTWTGCVLK